MEQRTILPDCCEDWILTYGKCYEEGEEFRCLECGTQWVKTGEGNYRRGSDKRAFVERSRTRGGEEYPYLAPQEGPEPVTQRCCARIILRHGQDTKVEHFVCPICRTEWRREMVARGGVNVPCFTRPDLAEPLTIQQGKPRPFLVPVSRHSPPHE
ncbi:MAG: hypothetical protein M1319_00325 [Chloroflexi bacterium]|nr:hypothetical protein [Chloroflexota bacterium]